MASAEYRIESNQPLAGRFLSLAGGQPVMVSDRALAVALAAKNIVSGCGQEVRVVHVPTGEIVFRKADSPRSWDDADE